MSSHRLFVISGPSGVGKSTLIEAALKDPGFRLAVSSTTRKPRPGEIHGIHYNFTNRETFRLMIRDGLLLEWAEVHGQYYGTPLDQVSGKPHGGVLLDIDVQGFRNVKKLGIPFTSVFIAPPSLEHLRERLIARKTENEEALKQRLAAAEREMAAMDEYDHVLVNDDLRACQAEFLGILGVAPSGADGSRPKDTES